MLGSNVKVRQFKVGGADRERERDDKLTLHLLELEGEPEAAPQRNEGLKSG